MDHIFARTNLSQRMLFLHDMWTHEHALGLGDVDDTVNVFWVAKRYKNVFVYVVNDTGDKRRYHGFMKKYHALLVQLCPTIQILKSDSEFPSVDKIVICAPLHEEHDKRMVDYVRTYTPGRLLYGQGDNPRAYNISSSALFPYLSFSTEKEPTLLTVDEGGTFHPVPITLYNTNTTNRKLTRDMLAEIAGPTLTQEVLMYAKHKLCFLPKKPFAVGLLLKKYGTGNTAYGLCHAQRLMTLDDMTDPDLILQAYFEQRSRDAGIPSDVYVEQLIHTYPTVQKYYDTMCLENLDKFSSWHDQRAFMRALAMVILCTLEWFGNHALKDRFRTLADDDVTALVDGTELYSPSMFDLIVGVAAVYDLTPSELNDLLPGGPNQLVSGPFVELLNVKLKKD